jgi:hypothetical protein
MTLLTAETLLRLAEARGVALSPERAASLVDSVEGLFVFVRELDEVVTPEVPPGTLFQPDD